MTARTETAAVVVVGCGPGGAVLAYLLARSGIDVALVERAATFEREYRGFGWNPGVVRLFDEMDLLDDVLALAHETVTEGSFSLYGEESTVLDFDLPIPTIRAADGAASAARLSRRPRQLLRQLHVSPCDYRHGHLYEHRRWNSGVTARDRDADEDVEFKTQCVVGADGRYSTVRASAGIDPGLFESPIDLVWFKLPRGAINATTQGRIDRNGVLLYFGLGGGDLQIGYLIRSGEWPSIRQAGFDAFRERVAEIDPRVGSTMAVQLDGFRDTSLLDVAPGIADSWSRDGLLLIGDAAHTASPIGAQGNPLAVEDAVVAHSLLVEKLTGTDGILERKTLHEFEVRRRAHVEQVISLQRRAATNLAYWLEYGRYVPPRLVRGMTKAARVIVPRSRSVRNTIETFALGQRSVSVDRSHFID